MASITERWVTSTPRRRRAEFALDMRERPQVNRKHYLDRLPLHLLVRFR